MKMLNNINNLLHIEAVPLSEVAQKFATPVFVYSENALQEAFAAYKNAFNQMNTLVCYAVKANGNLNILRLFAQMGSGFDIVSGGESARVLQAGGSADKVIFSGVGKTAAEIEFALKSGIKCFNVESMPELHRINEIAGSLKTVAPISFRINPNIDAKTHPYISTGLKNNKFGIPFEQAMSAYQTAQKMPNVKIVGVDCHIGSQLTEVEPLIAACEKIVALVDELSALGISLSHIDLGGGVGIQYKDETLIDLSVYANAVAKIVANRPLSLILEPGRSMVGNAGVLLTQVEYVKHGTDKNFIVVDAAMNDLARPALYDAYHDIVPVVQKNTPAITADIVGQICESGDFLGKNRSLAVEQGDLLCVKSAGAYGMSMSSNYNARPRAAEVLVSGSQSKLIRRRETMEDLWQAELI
ncbi:MAG: diaminopimelate decarboxylase [Neisseriaceae bacterium]|nr:diaminopimelate decarboxylase [Neisseriaceae bacterium]